MIVAFSWQIACFLWKILPFRRIWPHACLVVILTMHNLVKQNIHASSTFTYKHFLHGTNGWNPIMYSPTYFTHFSCWKETKAKKNKNALWSYTITQAWLLLMVMRLYWMLKDITLVMIDVGRFPFAINLIDVVHVEL